MTAEAMCAVCVPFAGLQGTLPEAALAASAEGDTYGNLTYDYLEDGAIEITWCLWQIFTIPMDILVILILLIR